MEAKRFEISALLRAGHSKSDIASQLKVSLRTVYRVADRLTNNNTLKDRPHSVRPQVIGRKTVSKAFENDPALKMTELAKKKIFVPTVSRVVKNEGGKSLRHVKRLLLYQVTQQKRHERCGRLSDLKHHGNRIIIFSDEKTFTVDPVINKQNDRVVGFDKSIFDVRCVSITKYPPLQSYLRTYLMCVVCPQPSIIRPLR